MFAAAMEDEELCRMVLERILEIPIRSVKVQSESVLLFNSDYRGIRMDVLRMMKMVRFMTWRCRLPIRGIFRKEAAFTSPRWMQGH